MFAVVEIQGKQYEVRVNDVLHVDTMHLDEDTKLTLDKVLLVDDNGAITVGAPYVAGMTVAAVALGEEKGDKIRVYRMKAKKRYRRTTGFRAQYTALKITSIGGKTTESSVKAATKKPSAAKGAAKSTEKKASTTAKKAAPKAAPKKTATTEA